MLISYVIKAAQDVATQKKETGGHQAYEFDHFTSVRIYRKMYIVTSLGFEPSRVLVTPSVSSLLDVYFPSRQPPQSIPCRCHAKNFDVISASQTHEVRECRTEREGAPQGQEVEEVVRG